MVAETQELLTIWTVRLAVACYVARYVVAVGVADGDRNARIGRRFWTAGCLLCLAHVVCAFAFVHDWSHQQAYEHTAEQTLKVVGWDWGGGLYFNYLFTILWAADVACWWIRGKEWRAFSPQAGRAIDLFLAFIVVNATVVFGPPFWKWFGAAVVLFMLLLLLRRRSENQP